MNSREGEALTKSRLRVDDRTDFTQAAWAARDRFSTCIGMAT